MNYREWVRRELRGLSTSMGFRYTPFKEIEGRISRLRKAMETQGMDASSLIRDVRRIKSPFEIELMRGAGEIGRKTFQRGREILKEGMTFAVEPKIVFPGEGSVGIENTLMVTRDGHEVLTPLEMDILEV
jgi:Xaa-Pro aminopeptidase